MTADVWKRLAGRVKAAGDRSRRDAESGAVRLYDRAPENIRELWKLRRLIEELIDDEMIRGRELDAPWDLLGTSKQQAQQRHARAIRQRELTQRRTRGARSVNTD